MKKQDSALSILLPLLLACAAIVAAAAFLPAPAGGEPQGWELTLSLEGARPFIAGEPSTLRAISTCGPVDVFLDGEKIGASGAASSLPLSLAAGNHTFIAEGEGCRSSLSVEVLARECSGNQTAPCEENGCAGVRRCLGGAYSGECSLPRKICVPGEKIGCSTDGCKFGYAACNACGNGFGECLPPANGTKSSGKGCTAGSGCN